MYYGRQLNEMRSHQMPQIFPNATAENRVICVTGKGSRNGLSALMCGTLPDLNLLEAGSQCFPLKLYKKTEVSSGDDLFLGHDNAKYQVRDGISDEALKHFQADIFRGSHQQRRLILLPVWDFAFRRLPYPVSQ